MPGSESYLEQATQWLDEKNEDYDVQLCVDLPEMGWITIHSISEDGGDVTCQYTSGILAGMTGGDTPDTMIFPVDRITAVRRKENLMSFIGRDR